ncbi:MAG: AbrB family transcriptional regulator [Neisseria sp.]|nr:AbrB family transcriptional regulator [Neisseria sp.]
MKKLFPYFIGIVAAVCGATAAVTLNWPIPYLLGALLFCAALNLSGCTIKPVPFGREMGLLIIGASLGLYFTPSMMALLVANWIWLLASAVFSIWLGVQGTYLLQKWAGADFETAWFASGVGGASEMAYMADKTSARTDWVVAAQALRVLMVAATVPTAYHFLGLHGYDDTVLDKNPLIHYGGLLALFGLAFVGVWLFRWRRWSNPWTFGPLLAVLLLTAGEIHLSAMPDYLSNLGQMLLGLALGSKFQKGFFGKAPRFLAVMAANIVLGLLWTALLAYLLSQISGLSAASIGLGLAPGGVAEMTVTAKVLHLGVPLVTVFHVCRMVAVIYSSGRMRLWFKPFLERKRR